MSYIIPNSNQFSTAIPGTYFTPSDLTVTQPGSDLPSIQTDAIEPNDTLAIELYLRRNSFETGGRPNEYIDADKVINLPYKKQLRYVASLDSSKLESWYGTSEKDVKAVKEYLNQHGATNLTIDQEQRTAIFEISYEKFRNAFLNNRPEILVNPSGGEAYYYNPTDFSGSYLTASGHGAKDFAAAVIGLDLYPLGISYGPATTMATSNSKPGTSKEDYYPTEIADFYNFPDPEQTNGGQGVVIGLVGSGANQFELLNQNNTFNKYLRIQGIQPKTLGKVNSPNDAGAKADWDEFAMDYSILRSIAPRADIKIGENSLTTFSRYADLIYDEDVDIISSSYGMLPGLGVFNNTQALHELFLDAVLRGKSFVQAAGDAGTGNYFGNILPNGQPTAIFGFGDSAILSVGGTSIPKTIEPNSRRTTDPITGLIDRQLMWNEYSFTPLKPIEELESMVEIDVYPTLQDRFNLDDFNGSTLVQGAFDNKAGSSGVFDPKILKMPTYQRKHLGNEWQNTGRRYPDVSVLAGGNAENQVRSYYATISLENGKPTQLRNGGTSAGAPLLAGLLATITSGLKKTFGKNTFTGFINPYLYEQYNSRQRKELFIDVPAGSNNASTYDVAESPDDWDGKFVAVIQGRVKHYLLPLNGTGVNGTLDANLSGTGKGFDAASGLGSINGQALFDGLSQIWSTL